ncbi:oligosaccharide flippase family protein, partial [Streptomyces sp. NPDC127092]
PALGILSGPILARALGPEGRGQFASVMQPITVAGAVASLGFPAAVAYFIASGGNSDRVYRRALATAAIPALLTYAAMCWYAGIVSHRQGISFTVICIAWSAIVLSAVVQIRRAYWQGQGRWRKLDAERAAYAVTRFGIVVLLALLGVVLAEAYVAASLLAFVAAALLLFTKGSPSRSESLPTSGEIVRYSVLASIGTIAAVASSRLDQILMPAAASSAELGYYAVAVTVAEVPLVLATLSARNALQLAAVGDSNIEIFRKTRVYIVVCIGLIAALFVAAPYGTVLVFGPDFATSASSIQLLSIAGVASLVSLVCGSILAGRGRPALASFVSLVSLLVTVLGFFMFWDSMSSLMAARISLISLVSSAVVGVGAILKVTQPRPARQEGAGHRQGASKELAVEGNTE